MDIIMEDCVVREVSGMEDGRATGGGDVFQVEGVGGDG